MSVGKTAMFASYAALQTASNNIANANTTGYSRQSVALADAPSQYTGGGFVGSGVDVTNITRSYDKYLTLQQLSTASTSSADAARLDKLTQLETVFPIGKAGIGNSAGELLNAFVDVSNNPSDSSARQVVISQAQELAARFNAAGDQLTSLQIGTAQDLTAGVASVNSNARQVAALNQQISGLQGTGQSPNQLLDQRDELVKQISQLIHVTTVEADDGSVGLFVGGGQTLVLGANASVMKAVPDVYDPGHLQLAMVEGATSRLIPPQSLSGGSLAGLLRFQNQDLVAANNLLGQMATAIGGAINAQQALGLDLGQPARAGSDLFSVAAPRVLPASSNTGTAAVSVTIDAASQLQASEYALSFDGSDYALTRLSDHTTAAGSPYSPAQLAAGVQVDGFTMQLSGGTANASDRFLLQPVIGGSQGIRSVLTDPNGIAAAAPFSGSTGGTNTGTASIRSLDAASPSYDPTLSTTITFGTADPASPGTRDYSYLTSDGSTGAGTWRPSQPIVLNGWQLQLDGAPRSGDTVQVAPTVSVASNNGNALAFSKLGDAATVGVSPTSPGYTITDAYASALADVGVRVQGGKTAAGISSAAATVASSAKTNSAGVNLDEEAAKLIQYQQSYQAAAKILQIAQTIFTSMLQMAAG